MCRGGVCTRIACDVINSLHTSIVPNTTCNPSKKLSPTIITWAPPMVHPSLGDIAFMHGVATGIGGYRPKRNNKRRRRRKTHLQKSKIGQRAFLAAAWLATHSQWTNMDKKKETENRTFSLRWGIVWKSFRFATTVQSVERHSRIRSPLNNHNKEIKTNKNYPVEGVNNCFLFISSPFYLYVLRLL